MTVNEYRRPGEPAPRPIPPIIERMAGRNFTDRGIEDHGVPVGPDSEPKDAPVLDYEAEEPFDFPAEGITAEPVPVYVVNNSPVEQKRFMAIQVPVASSPVLLIGQDRRRNRLRVRCDNDPVFIGSDSNVSINTGAVVQSADGYMEFITTDDVWAVCASTDTSNVFIVSEVWTDLRTIEDKIK